MSRSSHYRRDAEIRRVIQILSHKTKGVVSHSYINCLGTIRRPPGVTARRRLASLGFNRPAVMQADYAGRVRADDAVKGDWMADEPVPRPRVIGVINVTPDSFSVVGLFVSAEAAVSHGRRLWAEGADVLDVGGGSTRPGAIRPLQNGGLRARLGRRSP